MQNIFHSILQTNKKTILQSLTHFIKLWDSELYFDLVPIDRPDYVSSF